MMDFDTMWRFFEIGDEVGVSDSAPEPSKLSDQWSAWRSHNFVGSIVERWQESPRTIEISTHNLLGNEVSYFIIEGSVDRFYCTDNSPLSAIKAELIAAINAEAEQRILAAYPLYRQLNDAADQQEPGRADRLAEKNNIRSWSNELVDLASVAEDTETIAAIRAQLKG